MSADRRRAQRGARPASHRRRAGFRRRRPLLRLFLSAFLLVGLCAATGIAWEPRTVADARARSGPGPADTLPGTPGEGPAPTATGPVAAGPGASAPQSPGGQPPDPKAQGSGPDDAVRPTGALPFDMPQPAVLRSGAAGK